MSEGNSNIDGLYGYITNLRESITSTSLQIRKEHLKAKETIFNIAAHFGLPQFTRQKIQEIMEGMAVVAEKEVTSVRVNGSKDRKNKYKEKKKLPARVPDEDLRVGDPKKRVKTSNDEPKIK